MHFSQKFFNPFKLTKLNIPSFEKEIIKFYYRMLSHTYTENN